MPYLEAEVRLEEVVHFSTIGFMQLCQFLREGEVLMIFITQVRAPLIPNGGLWARVVTVSFMFLLSSLSLDLVLVVDLLII